jgi:hypothetical protein
MGIRRWLAEKVAGDRILLLGDKATPAQEVTIWDGPAVPDTWYKLMSNSSETIGHAYCCGGHALYPHHGGLFEDETEHTCGCGRKYQLKSYLERLAKRAREVAAYRAAGLSDNPTLVDLEMARKMKKTVDVKTGPISKDELKAAYATLAFRHANPSGVHSGQPRVIETDGSSGVVEYTGNAPGTTDLSGGMAFMDPMAARLSRAFAPQAEQRKEEKLDEKNEREFREWLKPRG